MTVGYIFKNGKLEHLSLPKLLFRYLRDDEFLVDSILESYLWFSDPDLFNDPFDCQNLFVMEASTEQIINYINHYVGDKLDKPTWEEYSSVLETGDGKKLMQKMIPAMYDGRKKIIAVCCFSDTPSNTLMWSHYANGHEGICLVYDTKHLVLSGQFQLIEVEYYDDLPKWDHISKRLRLGASDEFNTQYDNTLYGSKLKDWSYEQEHRLISHKKGKNTIPKTSLSGVVFGAKMPNERKRELESIILDRIPKVKFTDAELDRSSGSIKVRGFENSQLSVQISGTKHL